MTREQAKKRAEEIVYVYCTLGDIIARCQSAGIKTHTPNGRRRSRTDLEQDLIEHYTNLYGHN